jgi:hypothetical protein
VHNYSEATVNNRELYLGYFLVWAAERGLTQPKSITKPILWSCPASVDRLVS